MTEFIFFMGADMVGCVDKIFSANSGAWWRGKIYEQTNEPSMKEKNEE